ncbi:putative AMP-binding domain protein [delta proteobacterium NaphS2]|nr:putative AMP-binding domain protein [delta proteobacterium NaphS2]
MEIVTDTIGGMLDKMAQAYPARDALIHAQKGTRYTYQLLSWQVDRAARGLLALGIKRGDHVAIWAPNMPEWLVSMLAMARVGAVFVPIDPGAESGDLKYMLDQADCVTLMVSGELAERAAAIKTPLLKHIVVFSQRSEGVGMAWTELMDRGKEIKPEKLKEAANAVLPDDPVAIMYTSGTTGRPKGVVVDHLGLLNKSLCATERQKISQADRLCLFFPLFHMFGNTCIALSGLIRGAALVMPSEAFDASLVLETVAAEACTAIYGSPAMFISLLEHKSFEKAHWQTVRTGIVGGAPCPMALMKRLVEEIGVSELTVAYGITETSSWITMTHPHDPIALRVGTIGTPLSCNEVKIADPRTGEDLTPGTQGELCIRGSLMKEYYHMPGATAAVIDRDGWFHSGDLGEMDQKGYFKITGRLKDVIVRNGREIFPVEVEECLYGHPEISEVQVFGVPHPEKGQEVAAWVKVRENASLDESSLAASADAYVAKEMRPGYFKIVNEFPMTRSGKVQKFVLSELAEKEMKRDTP